ncbi:MAG: aldehyde dehydrogenase family protein [Alphaproteobacteria bacterium]|nr:aldehyde dehydrogenase family protein [Alphaproteobacteria bacterium]
MAPRAITAEEKQTVRDLVARARVAMKQIEGYDQAAIDRLIQAVGWATANEKTFTRLSRAGVDESGLGDRAGRPNKRFKLHGILRDALRAKSMGIVEEDKAKGIVKYAKPVGVIASLVPVTNAALTEAGNGIYSLKCKDAIIFSPHPASRNTTVEMVSVMRAAVKKLGVPQDVFQVIEKPSIPMAQELMAACDLTIATGGQAMVRAAYSSGKPAYGVGAGNATMVIDETADVEHAARNTRISKTSDNGSGCSADGNLLVDARIYDKFLEQLQKEGGYLVSPNEKKLLEKVMWDHEGHRTSNTIARSAARIAEIAGFDIGAGKTFLIVKEDKIGKTYPFSSEKLSPVLSIFRYDGGFDTVLKMVEQIYEVGGKGHSCGIYSFDDDHIHRLALAAPVSRMMVRQPQSKANAGAFDNGMPMTSSMGCGIWGGNITNENIGVKHYMQTTWVSRPIPEDRPSEQELFGEFYNTETF